jgi:hypothetical protein
VLISAALMKYSCRKEVVKYVFFMVFFFILYIPMYSKCLLSAVHLATNTSANLFCVGTNLLFVTRVKITLRVDHLGEMLQM